MIEASSHVTMVIGKARMYGTWRVKFKSRETLPTQPQTKETTLSGMHLK